MIDDFHTKGNEFLSNFYTCEIQYGRFVYGSSECAYMSAKREDVLWKEFCSENKPGVVKKKSKSVKIREDWNRIKIRVMFDVLRIKFAIPELRDMLLDTGDQQIVEGNNWGDKFWGVNKETGEGRNFLGRILMHIRQEIIDASATVK
jgi:ribA/ribD-fused uncharacterized protein